MDLSLPAAAHTPVLGFDPGNSDVAALLADSSDAPPALVAFSSAIGHGDLHDLRRIRSGSGGHSTLTADEYALVWNGHSSFVGHLALEHASHATTARNDIARYWSDHAKKLLLAALGTLLPPTAPTVRVVTGLPIQIWSQEHAARVRRALQGTHTFVLNGQPRTVTIIGVSVIMEGAGALALHGRTDHVPQAIIDIGGRTTDIFTTVGMQPLLQRCNGAPIGVEQVVDLLQSWVQTTHRRPLRPAEARQVMRAWIDHRPHDPLYAQGQRIELQDQVAQGVSAVAEHLRTFLSQTLYSGEQSDLAADIAHVVLIGGGAYYFADQVRRLIPHLVIPAHPEYANAYGYLALGRRMTDAQWRRFEYQ